MKSRFSPALLLVLVFFGAGSARAAETLPSASNVLQRVIERAKLVAQSTNNHVYDKRSLTEELDESERVSQSTEKHYRVLLIAGVPFPRLVRIQGRELTEEELERENKREAVFRERVTRVNFSRKAKRREGLATQDLIDRFEFRVLRREVVNERSTLVLTFAPRRNAPDKSIEDKIFGKVFGTVWVDEAEAEVAKLDASVRGPIPLGWFGAVGSLNKFQATLERIRLPDGVWANRKSTFWIMARKLFSGIHTRTTEESSGFRLE